jgi:hypothetical protein
MEKKTRQQQRAEKRKIIRSLLSKSDRRKLAKMKKSQQKPIKQAILNQNK